MATLQPLDPWAARSEVEIGAPMARVWRALTDPAVLCRWFPVHATGEPREGGMLRFGWGNGREDPLRIDEWSPPRHLRLRHAPGDEGAERVTEIHLRGRETRTHLRVETRGPTPSDQPGSNPRPESRTVSSNASPSRRARIRTRTAQHRRGHRPEAGAAPDVVHGTGTGSGSDHGARKARLWGSQRHNAPVSSIGHGGRPRPAAV
jgi:uncharacterized protein YndB with AHSA1/START domain